MPGQGMAALASAYVDTLAIEKIQGRDLGLVARRQIASGEVFFCERPIVKVTHANGGYRAKFSGDEAAGQSHLLSLAQNSKVTSNGEIAWDEVARAICPSAHGTQQTAIANALNTNTFLAHRVGARESVTFLTISRINHSCQPNCELRISLEPSELGAVKAIRSVAPGEELTINCNNGGLVEPVRMRLLL